MDGSGPPKTPPTHFKKKMGGGQKKEKVIALLLLSASVERVVSPVCGIFETGIIAKQITYVKSLFYQKVLINFK